MAWLHTAPSVKGKDTQPRIDTLAEESPFRALPDIELVEDIAGHFVRLGQANQGGFGMTPLNWGDVRDYCQQYGVQLTGWESEQIIKMSREYVATAQQAKQEHYPAPYADAEKAGEWRQTVSSGTKAAFGKTIK